MNHNDTTPITIRVPNDIIERIDAKRPQDMTREHIISLLVTLGLGVSQNIQIATPGNVQEVLEDPKNAQAAQRVELVAMRLRDHLRMYMDKAGTRQMSESPEIVAAVEEVIGAAMTSGWATACNMLGNGCPVFDFGTAVTLISQEFDYKVELFW
jgi:hypothetical protein